MEFYLYYVTNCEGSSFCLPRWGLILCILITYVVLFLCVVRGVATVGTGRLIKWLIDLNLVVAMITYTFAICGCLAGDWFMSLLQGFNEANRHKSRAPCLSMERICINTSYNFDFFLNLLKNIWRNIEKTFKNLSANGAIEFFQFAKWPIDQHTNLKQVQIYILKWRFHTQFT